MKERQEISLVEPAQTTRLAATQAVAAVEQNEHEQIEIGTWYWVKKDFEDGEKLDTPTWWLGCVIAVGSNFVEFKSPCEYSSQRIHSADLGTHVRKENEAAKYISEQIDKYKKEVEHWINQARELTKRLGVRDVLRLNSERNDTTALATCSSLNDVKAYQTALVEAKDKELPEIFKRIKAATEELNDWMSADAIHLEAISEQITQSVDHVKDKIFTVSLYSGITERVKHIQTGKPASFDARLHIMQKRLYMDEECLFHYQHGGITLADIGEFDKWLARSDNFHRIFPFERCMVSFQCRRNYKMRDAFNIEQMWVNVQLEKDDKKTFLYIRNGENLYRMECDLDFGHLMFGQNQSFDFTEPMMVKMSGNIVKEVIPKRQYDLLVEEYKSEVREYEAFLKLYEQWAQELERKKASGVKLSDDDKQFPHPYVSSPWHNPENEYEQFDSSSVYFDEATQHVKKQVDQYNRIALIVQGIFDRSSMLHPHPPVKMWDAASFNQAVKLVYDGTATVYDGEEPDFKQYVAECNKSIEIGSMVVGQEFFWLKREAEKENRRREARGINRDPVETFHPYGDPGPGLVAVVKEMAKRKSAVVFEWSRRRQIYHPYKQDKIDVSLTVPVDQLFNVSAYKPGDYKRFFNDPRSREKYLEWAPTLLLAEEIHAGNYNVLTNSKKS